MRSILKNLPAIKINEGVEKNISNGNDAEILSASLLLLAVGTEINWGSRNEDGRKIDLICSYDHPWFDKERLIFFVQVKSGDSYGTLLHRGFRLNATTKKAVQRTSHHVCLIWIHRKTHMAFWAYIHPHSTEQSQNYGGNHEITPAMRYDIARCQAISLPVKSGSEGVIIKEIGINVKEKRQIALSKYKELKTKDIICPNLGKIEITRIGWRHMFRKTRSLRNKERSYNIIKYFDKIINNLPSETYISKTEFQDLKNFQYRM